MKGFKSTWATLTVAHSGSRKKAFKMELSKLDWLAGLLLSLTIPLAQAADHVTLYVTDAQGTVVAELTPQGPGQPSLVAYEAAYLPYGQQVLDIPQAGPGYILKYCKSGGTCTTEPSSTTSVSGIYVTGIAYAVSVKACNASGCSPYSAAVDPDIQ